MFTGMWKQLRRFRLNEVKQLKNQQILTTKSSNIQNPKLNRLNTSIK